MKKWQENNKIFSDKLNGIYQVIAEYKATGKNGMIINSTLESEITADLIASGYDVSEYSKETHINW